MKYIKDLTNSKAKFSDFSENFSLAKLMKRKTEDTSTNISEVVK